MEERSLLAVGANGAFYDLASLRVLPEAYDASHVLVRFRDNVVRPQDYLRDCLDGRFASATVEKSLPLVPGLQKVRLGADASLDAALELLRDDPGVLYAEPDYRVTLAGIPNDPRFAEQWDLHNLGQTSGTIDADIDAPEAWDIATGTGDTLVAVIDTGVDFLHPDLASNIWVNSGEFPGDGLDNDGNGYVDDVHGYDFYNEDGNPRDDHGHGTHVAGTIGAVAGNARGIAGINWNVRMMALKFLGADGSGSTSDAIEAINYAVANGAQLSNNSWGGDPYSQALYDAIRDARDAHHIFVTAAGNGNVFGFGQNNDVAPFYPASYDLDNIVAVAATDHRDERAIFSNYGAQSVDLGAPGVSILSTTPNGGYGFNSGTSMAAPHVAGALSLVRDFEPGLTYGQIIKRVLTSVDPIDSMEGKTVSGGRLNLAAALVPDTIGPRILDSSPSGLQLDPVSAVRISFSESIDATTFTTSDIEMTGPTGAIASLGVQSVAGSNGREILLTFPTQSAPGEYQLLIGPDILDRQGNLLDQDGDGEGGETPDDRFATSFTLVEALARFDFGTATSPVAAGYARLVHTERYSVTTGYGWQSGAVYSISRSGADPLTRDFNYTADATFALELPNGEYDVRVTLGDNSIAHDQMAVVLEGVQVDSVATSVGQSFVGTYRASVSDGQLTLRLADLGGSDPWVMINALDVIFAGPDVTGPHVIATDPAGSAVGPIDRIEVAFSESILDGSVTLEDVLLLEGPAGSIATEAVNRLSGSTYEILFAPQNAAGTYRLVLGPNIADVAGNLLDQDRDGTPGENVEDRFDVTIALEAGPEYVARFDFGTATSPVSEGYTGLVHTERYSATTGYGWQIGSVYSIKRSGDDPLTSDFNYTADATFALDVANGQYDVQIVLGDNSLAHDQMAVVLEGVQVDVVATSAGQPFVGTYRASVSDGQLTLRLRDLGGDDPWVMINALDVIFAGPDLTGPYVLSTNPDVTAVGPIERIELVFSESLQDESLTLEDVLLLEGPAGAIAPEAVNRLSGSTYEVLFAAQNATGEYRLVVGPDIVDVGGNLLDQDRDGTGGETLDDRYDVTIALEAGPEYVARFDFGTATSPVAESYTSVVHTERYNATIGYGWQLGSVYSIKRSGADPLTRDFNYTADATFALDLPNGEYDVRVILGDNSLPHDLMGVSLEGVQVATVTTTAGQPFFGTYRISVADGQLTLHMRDLGGSDPWVMINALDVITVSGSTSALHANRDVSVVPSLNRWQDREVLPVRAALLDHVFHLITDTGDARDLLAAGRANTRIPSELRSHPTDVDAVFEAHSRSWYRPPSVRRAIL